MKQLLTVLFICLFSTIISAQKSMKEKPVLKQRGAEGFPDLIFTDIPGAPKLSKPILIRGTEQPVISQGMGLAAPAFYDWDGDGLKDLMVGEFLSGVENGKYIGNFVRVFKNVGTPEKPLFTGQFNYAKPPYKIFSDGTPYSVDQFCCIGFTPQFVDLNSDGHPDMITGQYYGEVSWFESSSKGFLPGKALSQEPPSTGDPRSDPPRGESKKHQYYWLYSSASFGDFTGDGKPDLITGGRELRISKNIGTATEPKFTQRQSLLDINGNPLKVHDYTQGELKQYQLLADFGYKPPVSGSEKLSPYVVDWDQDGTLDLLVTNGYGQGYAVVDFFKGVQTKDGYRFQPAVPLFSVQGDTNAKFKAFPGKAPRIAVVDWNNDGVNDLLIGACVVTVKGEFNDELSWNWEADEGLMKDDPAYAVSLLSNEDLLRFKQEVKLPKGITWEEYITIRHQGYVYVLLGHK